MPDSPADGSAPLDSDQVALLTAVVDRLIPSDALGPGARAAHADRYILQALGGPYGRYRDDYAAGLASIEARDVRDPATPDVRRCGDLGAIPLRSKRGQRGC